MFTNFSPTEIVFFLVSLLIAMIIHEVMHGVTAYWLGDTTAADMGRLTLNPFKHIDGLTTILLPLLLVLFGLPPIFAAKPVPFNPAKVKFGEYGAALVGAAGPITNFLLALIGSIILHIIGGGASVEVYNFFIIFIEVNVALMVFNLIPIPPLDGSRVLYAIAPEPVQEVMAKIESMGFLVMIGFIFIIFQFIATPFANMEISVVNFLLSI
jgi:Zn-dependent protease